MSESRATAIIKRRIGPRLVLLLNALATIQVVWFYLSRVECQIKLFAYEQGVERTPFQYRLLLMAPLRWAHQSHAINAAAVWLSAQQAFFPGGVRPEGIVQAVIDVASIGTAGLVARRLYQSGSRTQLLTPYVYPLTLLMVLSTYSLLTMHAYRFIYDLPSLAFFSLGLYLIYSRAHPAWFVAVFIVGTVNRETTLLLLFFFVLAKCSTATRFDWRQSCAAASLQIAVPLSLLWLAWHLWVTHLFRANASAEHPRTWLNLGTLAIPFTWPQLLGTFSYLLPLVILHRKHIQDPVLRAWLWGLPMWFGFMLHYGLFLETRIFGELIPYIACASALIAEEKMLIFLGRQRAQSADCFDRSERQQEAGQHIFVAS